MGRSTRKVLSSVMTRSDIVEHSLNQAHFNDLELSANLVRCGIVVLSSFCLTYAFGTLLCLDHSIKMIPSVIMVHFAYMGLSLGVELS